jgi:hypothetical protein
MGKMMRKVCVPVLAMFAALGVGPADSAAQVDLSAFVDFYYGYNFNKEDPSLRTFDILHNTFSLANAEVALEKEPTAASRIGGRIDLTFGPTADIVAGFEPGGGTEVYKHIQQGFISVMATDALTLDFGKFVTPLGAEVIESQNNWNYSRSILFGYAIPFYHSGVRATYAASDQLSISGYVVNGWNNTFETNSEKTFIGSVGLIPSDQVMWYGNIIAGKEDDFDGDGDEDMLWLFDTSLTFQATPTITLMGNFDYGSASDFVATDEAGTWWGIAAYARLQAQEDWAVAGRFEFIDDEDSGFMTIGQTAQSFTATSDHTIFDDLIGRLELRFDTTDNNTIFTDADGDATQNQLTLTAGMVYALPLGG